MILPQNGFPLLTAGERLDRLPVTSRHMKIFWLLAAGLFIDSTEIFLGGGVSAALLRDGWSTLELNADFQFFTFLGLSLGAVGAGFISDRYGRRFAFQFNLLLFGLCSLSAAFAPNIHWLIALRFLMGIGLGAEIVVIYPTLTEFIPAHVRGRFLALLVISGAATLFAASLISYLVIPTLGWRPCFLIIGMASVVLWYLRRLMPESPRWLVSVGRYEEAEKILRMLEGEHYQDAVPVNATLEPTVTSPSFTVLFQKEMLSRTFSAASISIAVNIALYSFTTWWPSFLVKQGSTISYSLGMSALMTGGAPLGAVIALALSDKLGRKPLIITGLLCAGLFGALYPTAHSLALAVFYAFLLNAFLYFVVAVGTAGYVAEVFPTNCRLRAVGFVGMSSRVAAMLCPYAVVPIYAWGGVTAVIVAVATILLTVPIIVWIWGVEPAGLSLENASGQATENILQ